MTTKSTHRWRPFPWYLLRATGMPFDWLAEAGGAPAWELDPDAFDAAMAHARRHLGALLDRPLVQEALFISNPALGADRVAAWQRSLATDRRRAKDRARERTVWRYLQRFCAKNDTTSFFGATSLGRFDAAAERTSPMPIAAHRRAFLEHWAADVLVDAAVADFDGAAPGGWHTRPRRAPNLRVTADAVVRDDGATAERWEGVAYVAAARLADGARDVATLADAVARAAGCQPGEAADAVTTLLGAGALSGAVHPAIGAVDPLGDLRDAVAEQPASPTRERWLGALDGLRDGLDAFAGAAPPERRAAFTDLEARFEAQTGRSPRRSAGEFYASRTVVHEVADRSGQPTALGPRVSSAVQAALAPLVELCDLHTLADRWTFRAWFDAAMGPGEHRFADVARAYRAAGVRVHLATPERARALRRDLEGVRQTFREAIDAHVAAHGLERPCVLPTAALAEVRERWGADVQADGAAYANPDLLVGDLRERGGPLRVVVGDVHAMPYLTPALFAAAPSIDSVVGDTRAWLADLCAPALPALPAVGRRSFMAFEPDLGQVGLEVDGLPPVPHERRAAMDDLRLAADADGFHFSVATYDGRPREVMPLVRAANLMSRFSELVQLAARVHPVRLLDVADWLAATGWRTTDALPRLLWGQDDPGLEVVVARRRFRVRSERWAKAPSLAEALRLLADATGRAMPRFCFTKAPSEPKPLLVDWANPVAAEMALWLARREPELVFAEMLPEPGGLWLGGPEGRHTSELRVVFARGAPTR